MQKIKKYKNFFLPVVLVCLATVWSFKPVNNKAAKRHVLAIKTASDLKEFFHYTPDRLPFISSHRGGPLKGYPENCIATFENTLSHTWSLMEFDPHYTKDSNIVIMHDPTLDRTSNGHGKISDYTLSELKQFRLKDTEGNLTAYSMPTLDEVLEWAKGKTVMVLDMKDVPIEVRAKKITEHHAETAAIIIAYSFDDAKKCYAINKDIMMEVMIPDEAKLKEFETTGVPWQNVVAFVTHTQPKENDIFQKIHEKGTMCIRGSSRTIDRDYTTGKNKSLDTLMSQYNRMVTTGTDIIEADLGIEAGAGIEKLRQAKSPKQKFFKLSDK